MKQFLIYSALLLVFIACEDIDVPKAMKTFDRAFVPVWYHTYQKDESNARKYASIFVQHWQDLKSEYQYIPIPSSDWEETYDCIDDLVEQAAIAIEQGDLPEAYLNLDGIRFELTELRKRYDISYYLDQLWDFQLAYDMVLQQTHPDVLYIKEWHEFDCLVEDMNLAWQEVEQANLDRIWDKEKEQIWHQLKATIRQQLSEFDATVKEATIEETLLYSNILQIEPNMLELIYLFGDFKFD